MNPPRTLPIPEPDQAGIRQDVATGILCALIDLLFGTAIAALLEKLQALFDAFRAGTLPPIPAPAPSPVRPVTIQAKPSPRDRRPKSARRPSHARLAPLLASRVRALLPQLRAAEECPPRRRVSLALAHSPPGFLRKTTFSTLPTHA